MENNKEKKLNVGSNVQPKKIMGELVYSVKLEGVEEVKKQITEIYSLLDGLYEYINNLKLEIIEVDQNGRTE